MGKTIAEKIFSLKANLDVNAGDTVDAQIDAILTNDASGPLSIDYFEKMGGVKVVNPERVVAIIDHYVPCPSSKVAALHQKLYDFRDKYNIRLEEAGQGIAHQVFDELKYVRPGWLIIGGDSHSTTHGYLGNVSVGVGASDLAFALITGKLWFKVPQTIKVIFKGKQKQNVSGKDIAIYMLTKLGSDGANYKALEFHGDGLENLSMEDRKIICNLAAECSAKCAIMPIDEKAINYCKSREIEIPQIIQADEDSNYIETIEIDLAEIEPMVSLPCRADNAVTLNEIEGLKIDMVLIGTCTNGRISDFEVVDSIIKNKNGKFKVETLIVPSSFETYKQMVERGYLANLLEKGAMVLPPGCGPCCGSSPGIPRDGFKVLSTANRNFLGRMGNTKAEIYLCSPAVAAASALTGGITNPSQEKAYV